MLYIVAARYLQNLTIQTTGNSLTANCHFAKSDNIVGCQLIILPVEQQNTTILNVSVALSEIFMDLTYSDGNVSVIARAVSINGAPLDDFNITRTFIAPSIISSVDQSSGKCYSTMCCLSSPHTYCKQ